MEEPLDCVDPDDACLAKSASDTISGVARAPVWDMAALEPAAVLPPLIASIGLVADTLREMRVKLVGVIEGFQIEQNDLGQRVFLPVLQHVGCCDVRPVADAYVTGEAYVRILRILQYAQAQGAALGDEGKVPWGGNMSANDALSLTRGSVLMSPMQLGPMMRMPYPNAVSRRSISRAAPSGPLFPETIGDDDETLTFFLPHSSATLSTWMRNGDYREVDAIGNIEDRRVGLDRHDRIGGRGDRIDDAGKPAAYHRLKYQLSYRTGPV